MDHLPINSRSMTENTLAQEQRRHCIAGVTYCALFSSTTQLCDGGISMALSCGVGMIIFSWAHSNDIDSS